MILGVYGMGGLGLEIYEFALKLNNRKNRWKDILFIDDTKKTVVNGEIKHFSFEDIKDTYSKSELEIVIAQGEPLYRELIYDKVKLFDYQLATLLHPNFYINSSLIIKSGVIINSNMVTVSPEVIIGHNTLIQPFVTIGHNTKIGENCVVSAFSSIAGDCHIGDNVYIGMHVAIKEKTVIGDNAIIGMGSMVTRNVPNNHTVFLQNTRMVEHEKGTKVFNNSKDK
ncbi:MAG: sugar O-acyltransferase [Firmicutes bacterium]|nr:sugar O-acyltransferase [Bacillota bacterium]